MRTLAFTVLALGISSLALMQAQVSTVPPSPNWNRAMPNGPDESVKITEEYAKLVGRDAYFWSWPMVNIYNLMLQPAKPMTNAAYNYADDKINYSRNKQRGLTRFEKY